MSWPLAEPSRAPVVVPRRRRRKTPRYVWLLVAAAFLCGGALSAAGFAVGWKHQAQRDTTAESALVVANATVHTLRTQLASARARLAAERTHATGLAAAKKSLTRAETRIRTQLATAKQSLAAVGTAAAPLAADLDRLTNELRALTSYVTSTPAGQLDAGYVQAQLAYLAKTVDGFRTAVSALASQAR
ncbi:MAG: hypothetical protein JOY72_00030 [Actinobacteria bacterium]|nr:hypothetical protein [Actinomycetota bacterium]